MKSKNSTKETIKQWLHVSASPKTRARIWREVLFVQERSGRANPALVLPYIWRTIMRSPITKLTATTVMVIAVVFLTTFLDKATTPLYALEQTIEANHTTKTIHLRMFKGAESIENNEFSNYWIKYDDAGKLSNLRCNEHDDDGVSFTVWNNGIAKTWIPENNVVIIIRENNTEEEFEDFAKEYDPKLSLQRLYDLSKEEEIELKIAEDSNSIYVNAIHSGYKERVDVVVDRQTKLMKKFSKYRLKDQEYKLDMQIEFLAYNKPIDMSVFQLSGIPDDALVYDKVNQLVGLKKGDLTKEEIADRVVHEALQATIAKDYDEVSRLIGGDPGDTIEEFIDKEFEGRLARIISIGQPKPDEKFKHILCVPCEIEVKSEESERSIAKIIAKAASIEYQPGNRWIMRTDLRVSEPYIPLTIAFNEKDLIKDNLIVLGERIGEYTLGMSKDEVLRKLGEPEAIYLDGEGDDVVRRGEEKYNLNNLPNEYVMVFGDISFWIDDESVKGTFVRSPLYKLSNGLGVGDSVQKIKAFGDNFQLEKAMGKDFRCYHAKGLAFGIHEKSQTIAEIVVYEPEDNRNLPDQQEYVKHTIVPGLCVGDYTLGMSKDDVLKKLGKPKGIFFGGERYTLDDLPRQYFLFFGDISFRIKDDAVIEIGVHSPLYKFPNGVRVGDSEQKIRQAFGDNFQLEEGIQLEEGRGKDFLTYEDKGVHFEISKRERTVMEIGIRPTAGNHRDSDTPDSYKAIIINEQPTGPIKFPKIDRRPPATNYHRGKMTELPTYDADSTDTWQVDLRAYDLSMLDLRDSLESLFYADFDDRTVWPSDSRMPQDFYPRSIMELGKNPGLGIRDLHSQGITGKSVGIAIIDQTLLVDHKEYKNQLRFYEETDDITGGWLRSQMHGPAVASIAVGKTVGVAPEADLYYIATARGGQGEDFSYLARSIRRVLQVNEQLPKQRKIRVIAMAIGWGEKVKGYEDVTEAAQEAKDAGMLVICSSVEKVHGFRFHGLGRHPLANPNVFESYEAGLWWAKKYYDGVRWRDSDRLLVPMDSRTTASPLGNDEYVFYRQGGWSWAIPYIAGVYALAAQVEPAITPEQFWSLAIKTGNTIQLDKKGKVIPFGPIIDPVRLIRSISDDVSVSQRMPLKHTIVPGIRIGDYTIGMSKDGVLAELGEPEAICLDEDGDDVVRRGEEKYNLDNLPREFLMAFGDVSFWIENDSVNMIFMRSPFYKLSNGLGVGDSAQKIKQAFGEDFQLEEALGKDFHCYHTRGLAFEIHEKSQTIAEIIVYKPEGNRGDPDSPDSAKVALIRKAAEDGRISFKLTTPDEFKTIAGRPTREWADGDDVICMEYPGIEVRFFGKPNVDIPYTLVDLSCEGRGIDIGRNRPIILRDEGDLDKFGTFWGYSSVDLSRLDLSQKGKLLKTMTFDSRTVWPESDRLPPDFDPKAVIEWGKYPGLRVKQLHDQGITGKGVHVAIIDQPLLLGHIEYRDQLVSYKEIETGNADPQMHGPPVASILVGKTCGVAPEAILHYWAEPSWKRDYKYRCMALEQIIQFNKGKEKSEQIRVVSISKGFSSSEPNLDRWKTLLEEAKKSGIYVVHCSSMGFGAGCRFMKDSDNPANYRLCAFLQEGGFRGKPSSFFTPIDNRTTASHRARDAYTFWTRSGLSWGAPYYAGVVALGIQVNPDLRPDQIDKLLYDSGWDFQRGKLINPVCFVKAARAAGADGQ